MSLLKIIGILTHPARWINEKTLVVRSRFQGVKFNQIETDSSVIKKSGITFAGKENAVRLHKVELFNTTVFIRGRGHKLIVGENVKLYNLHIKIIGNRNVVHIGTGTSFGGGCIVCGGNDNSVTIGENCVFAEGVDIWGTDTHSIFQGGQLVNVPKSISIGNHVWAGKDVAILKGVSVGDGAVIGMRSIVTRDIPANTLSVGNPAQPIKDQVDWSIKNPNN